VTIQGLHHITLVCKDAQRTVDFYTKMLGLRLVKTTVNFDDPGAYHLYFGDETGCARRAPASGHGSVVTFFEWPSAAPGKPGIGGTHHFALTVADYDGLLRWKRRLNDLGMRVNGPYDRHYFKSLYLRDPNGTLVEIATRGPGWTVDELADAIGTAHQDPPAEMIAALGERLMLPPWLEPHRSEIEAQLRPIAL
jgi:glyoxalase family protein